MLTQQKRKRCHESLVIVCNFTQVVREDYRIGLPKNGDLVEIFNTDNKIYGGSGLKNSNSIKINSSPYDGRDYSAKILLAPLSVTVFKIS